MQWQNEPDKGTSERVLRLAAAVGPLTFAREFLGFFPDAAQAAVMNRAVSFREIVLNCSRQWGKSTIVAVLILHRMLTQAGATVLVVGPGARQSGETVQKVRTFLRVLGIKTRGDGTNRDSAVLPNGSRIVGLPAKEATIRGFSAVTILVIEEAARVPDEVCLSLLPALAASNGDLIVLSTPWEKRGFFYRMMTEEGEGRLRYTGPVGECSRVSEAALAKARLGGEAYFRREYLCEFLETGKYLIAEQLVNKAVNPKEEAWRWL